MVKRSELSWVPVLTAGLPAASGVTLSLIGRFQQLSEITSVPHGVLYLSVELSDDSVFVGVNAGPKQSVSLLEQAAQMFVSALVHMMRGGGATQG